MSFIIKHKNINEQMFLEMNYFTNTNTGYWNLYDGAELICTSKSIPLVGVPSNKVFEIIVKDY